MAARRPVPPRTRAGLMPIKVQDSATDRALDELATGVARMQSVGDRIPITTDLAIGDNVISHGLGRIPNGVNLTPTVADATFAWALTSSDERKVVINVIGAAQPGAGLEIY
jgi:hypothetical protein